MELEFLLHKIEEQKIALNEEVKRDYSNSAIGGSVTSFFLGLMALSFSREPAISLGIGMLGGACGTALGALQDRENHRALVRSRNYSKSRITEFEGQCSQFDNNEAVITYTKVEFDLIAGFLLDIH